MYMSAVELIISMYCENCLFNGPQPMTEKEAAYNLKEYRETDGIVFPDYVTPALFSKTWNIYYKKDMEKGVEKA